jgi:hypothetical protein
MSEQEEILKQFRQQQEKYTYYIIALCVAGIGFAIQKTSGQPLRIAQIPLGAGVLSWGISVYCGLTFMGYVISNLYANSAYFDVLKGVHPLTGTRSENIQVGANAMMEVMQKNSDTASRYAKWQNRLFYFGIVCFIGWQIWEMYIITKK